MAAVIGGVSTGAIAAALSTTRSPGSHRLRSVRGVLGVLALAAVCALQAVGAAAQTTVELVPLGATWLYLDDGSSGPAGWQETGFDDSAWAAGPAQLGYGDGDEATVVSFGPDPADKHITTFFRHQFELADLSGLNSFSLELLRDDGALVYFNGTEVARSNLPAGALDAQTLSSTTVSGAAEQELHLFSLDPRLVVVGTNTLAVEVHQRGPTSSDLSFDLRLEASDAPPQKLDLVPFGAAWRYLDDGTRPAGWNGSSYDDAAWLTGPAELGYGDGDEATVISFGGDPDNKHTTAHFRHTFDPGDTSQWLRYELELVRDDGAIVYLNGTEIARSNMPPDPTDEFTFASSVLGNAVEGQIQRFAVDPALVLPAANLLAAAVHQANLTSSDTSFDARLVAYSTAQQVSRGPYLQLGTPNSVVVRWRTDVASASRVSYATDLAGPWTDVVNAAATTEHEVLVDGLVPATRYYYAVGSDVELLVQGAALTFRTAPLVGAATPTRVWILGDSGTGNADAMAVRDAFVSLNGSPETDVWLMLGDNAYPDGTDAEYQTAVFETYPEQLEKMPLWPAIGNHDGRSSDSPSQTGPYFDMFTLPHAAQAGGMPSGTEAYYSFDYANVHFIALDSHDSDRSVGGAMYQWLLDDLATTSQEWIVAFWHHPPYSKGSHDSDVEARLVHMRQNFLPLLESFGVDLVFSGHSHSYERSYLLDSHYGASTSLEEWMKLDPGDGAPSGDGAYRKSQYAAQANNDGGVYVVAGSSGKITNAPIDHPAMVFSVVELGSVVLDFDGPSAVVRFLDDEANVLDTFEIAKDDAALFDYGDAPEPGFETLQASNGARHRQTAGDLHLGDAVTSEDDGQPAPLADADAGDDGVTLVGALVPGATASFEIRAGAAGRLDAWLDWNGDGDWDDEQERVATDFALVPGDQTLQVTTPASLGSAVEVLGRFRLSSRGGLAPRGKAEDGEVEDHLFVSAALVDLEVAKTDGLDETTAGEAHTYTVTVSNHGPADAFGAQVLDTVPTPLEGATWTCAASAGASCAASGVGDLAELVDLPAGSQVVFEISGVLLVTYEGELVNTASIAPPGDVHDVAPGNDSATDRTTVALPDGEPPTVVTPIIVPGGFPPAACQEVRQAPQRLDLELSEALWDPPGSSEPGDITAPGSARVVSAGADTRLETLGCSEVSGDDLQVLPGVTWDAATNTVGVDLVGSWAGGVARIFLCDTVRDPAGNALDGDADGAAGGDFTQQLRLVRSNLVNHAQIDCSIEGFDAVAGAWNASDRLGDPASGSLELVLAAAEGAPLGGAAEQCLVTPDAAQGDLLVGVSAAVLGEGALVGLAVSCTAHQALDCSDPGLGTFSTPTSQLAGTADAAFSSRKWRFPLPAQTQAARCSWQVQSDQGSPTVLLDGFLALDGVIEFWDFESGQLP